MKTYLFILIIVFLCIIVLGLNAETPDNSTHVIMSADVTSGNLEIFGDLEVASTVGITGTEFFAEDFGDIWELSGGKSITFTFNLPQRAQNVSMKVCEVGYPDNAAKETMFIINGQQLTNPSAKPNTRKTHHFVALAGKIQAGNNVIKIGTCKGSLGLQNLTISYNLPLVTTGKDDAPMVLIPAREFQMGSNNGSDDEKPVHTVYLDAFYMDKHEVTVGQYKKFICATGHPAPDWAKVSKNSPTDEHPIIYVSWHDAQAYCKWAQERLPTEAEWEKAARGGLVGKKYPWGDEILSTELVGNFADKTAEEKLSYPTTISGYNDGYARAAPVGKFAPNGYGLYDMAGNVWEWCSDWYDKNCYVNNPKNNPQGPCCGSSNLKNNPQGPPPW